MAGAKENLEMVMVVVRREGVRRGPWLYTVEGALWRALPDVRFVMFCASLEAGHGCSRPNSFVRLVLAAEPRLTLTRSYCVDPQ